MKKFSSILLILFCVVSLAFLPAIADAKGGSSGGGGGRGGGFSSSSPSVSSSSRPSYSSPTSSSPKVNNSFTGSFDSGTPKVTSTPKTSSTSSPTYSSSPKVNNSFTGSFGSGTPKVTKTSIMNNAPKVDSTKFAKQGNSISSYNNTSKPTIPNSYTSSSGKTYTFITHNTNYYSNPPSYVYNTHSSFGGWDSMMLFMMLDHSNKVNAQAAANQATANALNNQGAFFYHRQNDEGVKAFLAEAEVLAKDNEDLRKQLDEVKKSMEEMKAANVAIDPDFVPDNVEAVEVDEDDDDSWGFGTIVLVGFSVASILLVWHFYSNRRRRW
jgi:hypothetical protein